MYKDITIRFAKTEDAATLAEIYSPYVLETAITFEYAVPSVKEFAKRIEDISRKYPYLVAECGRDIAGYAYASPFAERAAYDWCAQTTIYVKKGKVKQGIGKKLYAALECILKEMHICNLAACIGYPKTEDEYLTKNSVGFHKHFGYTMAGEFHQCGYKFGRWYNMVWMEKKIGDHLKTPPAVINVNEIRKILKEKYQIE